MFILVGSAPVGSGIIAAGSRAHAEAPSRAFEAGALAGPERASGSVTNREWLE